jgi:transcriptional regulator with XRE-family HTH domain
VDARKVVQDILKVQPHKSKLAEELYISRNALYGWLNGKNVPKSKAVIIRFKKVAKKYGVKIV